MATDYSSLLGGLSGSQSTLNSDADELAKLMALLSKNKAFLEAESDAAKQRVVNQTAGDLGLNVALLGGSIAQIIAGANKLNKLQRPTLPTLPTPDSEMANRRSMAKLEAEQVRPELTRALQNAAANAYAKDRAVAMGVSGGDVNRYAALMQANGLRQLGNERQGLLEAERERTAKQGMYDSLLAQKQQENRFLYGANWDRYNAQNSIYNQERTHGSGLLNQGLSNLIGAGGNLAAGIPNAMYYRQMSNFGKPDNVPPLPLRGVDVPMAVPSVNGIVPPNGVDKRNIDYYDYLFGNAWRNWRR